MSNKLYKMKQERKKRIIQLAVWTWSWVGTLAIATLGPKFIWNEHSVFTTFAIMLNLFNGILMILANRKLFNHFDELERKIHLESMGLTLGLSVIVSLSFSLLVQTDLIPSMKLNDGIGFLIAFIGITYMITLVINRKRYS